MILVTGGTGLVGSHLLFELTSSGKKVRALKRASSDIGLVERLFKHYSKDYIKLLEHIEWIDGDIDDYLFITSLLEGVKEVYHCAAVVSFNRKDDEIMLKTNVQVTANLVDACLHAKVDKFCHVSSIAVLGGSTEAIIDETIQWGKSKGKSGYAISKFRGEMEVWRGFEQGLNAVVLMPSIIVGPGKWGGSSGNLLGALSKGFPFYTHGVTGYVDARDVAKCMVIAMGKGLWGKRFILNSENLSYKEVFSLIAKEFGKRPPSIEAKPWMGYLVLPFIWLFSQITRKAPSVTLNSLRSSYKKSFYSSALAQEVLGIKFVPLSESVANAIKAGPL
jgi:nucleoside-diphosphate-sugar epimerase